MWTTGQQLTKRVITETAGKVNHRIVVDRAGWQLVLTLGLKNPLRQRLEGHGNMGMRHGTRQVLKVESLGVRSKPPEPDMEPGQSIPRGHWSGHWGGINRWCMCVGGRSGGKDFFLIHSPLPTWSA